MKENNTKGKIKNYLLSGSLCKADAAVAAVLILLIVAIQMVSMPLSEALKDSTEVSYGYKAVEAGGLYYVIDSGHERLLCFDKDSRARFALTEGPDGFGLYIDDVSVGKDSLYITVSEWDGMLLAGEKVLKYDLDGKYIDTVAVRDYAADNEVVNKHKLYGVQASDEGVSYAECLKDKVVFYTNDEAVYTLNYDDAFNAVSDIAISGSDLIILNKNGEIRRFDPSGNDNLIYTTEWAAQRIRIPFRIGLSGDNVLFTDIRTQTVLITDAANETASIVAYETESQTVTAAEDGSGVLLTDSEGLRVTGKKDTVYTTVRKSTPVLVRQTAFLLVVILLAAAVVITLIRLIMILKANKGKKVSGSDTLIVLGMAAFVGIIVSAMLLGAFEDSYKDKIREQLKTTAYVVAAGIDESDLDGVVLARDFGNEAYENLCTTMKNAIPMNVDFSRTAYCNIMRLSDEGNYGYAIAYLDQSIGTFFRVDDFEKKELQEVYDTGKPVWNDQSADVSGTYLSVKVPIKGEDGSVVGVVAVGSDTYVVQDMIGAMRRKVLLSIVAIVLLLWIVISEATSFIKARSEYVENAVKGRMPAHLVRILIFTIFSAYNLVSSFLPVYILRNSDALPAAWRSTGAALPMTVNIFVMGIMSLFCAKAVRKLGIKRVFMISMLCSLTGNLVIVLLKGYAPIMAGLVLDGIGVGLITNAVYVMLTYLPDEAERQEGFAIYNTASLSGINFGMILGGLLATNIGQKNVFFVAALFWGVLLLLGSYLTGTLAGILKAPDEEEDTEDRHTVGKFLRNRSIWSFIVLIQNPYIIFNSFIFYFVPLFSDGLGYGEVMASVFLMLYSETAVMLGKSLPDQVEKKLGSRALYAAIGLNVLAVAIFTITWNVQGLIISLLLLGLSASFAKPSQQTYFLGLKATQKYGEDRAMGIYNFSENIGESLGPVVFGRLMAGTQAGIMAFLGLIVALGGAHFALNGKEIRKDA